MTSPTPVSDCISALVAGPSDAKWTAFFERVRNAQLGVIAEGVPTGAVGAYRTQGTEVGLGQTRTPDGRIMILACADPDVFRTLHPTQPFNAEMAAAVLFEIALADENCAGVLVNSAASMHSLPLSRDDLAELVSPRR